MNCWQHSVEHGQHQMPCECQTEKDYDAGYNDANKEFLPALQVVKKVHQKRNPTIVMRVSLSFPNLSGEMTSDSSLL